MWMPCVLIVRWPALILLDRFSDRHLRRLPNLDFIVFESDVYRAFDIVKDAKLHEFS
jgi:hypothetical protein